MNILWRILQKRTISLCGVIFGAAALLLTCVKPQNKPPDYRENQIAFRAVYISDTHVSNDMEKDARLKRLVDILNEQKPPKVELLLHGGDLVSSVFDKHPQQFPQQAVNRLAKAVQILNRLHIPWYPAMGNHDYKLWSGRDSDAYFPEAEILQMEKIWKKHTGRDPYYAVEHRGWNFIVLNSMRGRYLHRHFDDEQMRFFEQELEKGLPTIVVTHFPLKTDHFKIWAKPKDLITSQNEPRFFALLKKYQDRIKGIFVGHGHMWRQDMLFDRIPVFEVDDFAEENDMPHYVIEFYSSPYRIVVQKGEVKKPR
ncbi:MAG: hypothetical protein D6681_04770 [Calditrichaeota bacterium]|nr:MAG: hypothetical protein D6681_04770 [Calditrichota bacterium]